MKTITRTWIDSGDAFGRFSFATQEFLIKDNGQEFPIGDQHRTAIAPSDRSNIEAIVPAIDSNMKGVLETIWTDEVVEVFKKHVLENGSLEEQVEGE